MKKSLPFVKLTAGLFAAAVMTCSSVYADDCPSDAICRYDEAPGNYSGDGPYRVDDYNMPWFSTPGGATVYYPEDAQAPYSVVVFTPPYSGSQYMYANWGPFFASHGIVLVTMDTSTIYDSVDSRADQQQEVLDAIKSENTRRRSPLYGKLDTNRLGATGWSMGGGATWITASEYNGLKTAMSLAGHNATALDSDARGGNIKVPTILFNGDNDSTILGGLGQSDGVYDAIPNGIPKIFYELNSVGHYAWGGPTAANDYVAELALAFHKTFLDGDTRWAQFLDQPPRDVNKFESDNIPN